MTTAFIGQPVSRVDGRQKVTGRATYAAEFDQPGQAHGAIVRSTVASGRIASIDSAGAERASGVIAVLTRRNAPRLVYRSHRAAVDPDIGERLHVLQDDRVSHQGQPIALVIADTLEQANHAATLVRVAYAAETGTTDVSRVEPVLPTQQQTDQGARRPPETQRGDAQGALARAEVKIDQTYVIPRENHNPIEMHATIAAWNGDRLTLWDKTQWVHNTADEIAAVFGIPAENIRVVSPFVGGAFGSGLRTWPHVTLAALGARVARRPVKVMLSRREMYYGVGYRPHTVQRVALGASRDGRLAAIMHDGYQETSTYEEFSEALLNASRFLHSCPNVYTRHRIARLNVHTPTYMRAPGEASGVFALESAMDELAVALSIDPVELRLRNEPEQDEFRKVPFSSRSTRECYRIAAERFGWSRRNAEPRSMRDGRWLIGWGMASATYPTNYAPASATARLLPDGTAEVTSAASDMGPGTWTSMTQVAAETLGLPIERVKFSLGDTQLPRAPVHGGSMTMASVGSAVQAACRRAREDALARGGANDLAAAMRRLGQPVEASADVKPGDASQRLSMHAFGAVFVEVTVDPDLGETRVRRIVGAYGAGRIVNPKTTRSQCIGGMIGGIGMALMEHSVVDSRNGRVPNANFAEYAVPVHADAPPVMDVIFVEEHDPHVNPLGVKGVGEIAMVGVAPAIANAIFHATGKRIRELPITPDNSFEGDASRSPESRTMITRRRILAGTGGLATLVAAGAAAAQGPNVPPQARNGAMQITRSGSRPSARGPADYFTGPVRVDPLFQAGDPARVSGGHVTFEPGARSAWHTHPLGQTLIVTSGLGWVQGEGGPIEEIRPGDVVWFPPGLKHWHGATPTTAMTHIAITEFQNGKNVDWLEKVSDEQYRR